MAAWSADFMPSQSLMHWLLERLYLANYHHVFLFYTAQNVFLVSCTCAEQCLNVGLLWFLKLAHLNDERHCCEHMFSQFQPEIGVNISPVITELRDFCHK